MAAPHLHRRDTARRGTDAERPQDIPRRGWIEIAKRTKDEAKADDVPLLAAGVAFDALLALVPGLAALVSIYGLVADPADIDRQVGDVLAGAPAEVRDLVAQQMDSITQQSSRGLGLTAALGIVLALSAAAVVVGAEINAEAERQTAADSTVGRERPLGRRRATAADHVAAPAES